MANDPASSDQPINQYAIVTYIPDRLGDFLNNLRQELIPGSTGLAHVTVLPPRKLAIPQGDSADWISARIEGSYQFDIGMAEIQVFDKTDVIYAEIGMGRESLLDLHDRLNVVPLWVMEEFPYHPHITLAQNIDHKLIPEMFNHARQRWNEFAYKRAFLLDRITFVQNTEQNHWIDLAWYELPPED